MVCDLWFVLVQTHVSSRGTAEKGPAEATGIGALDGLRQSLQVGSVLAGC